MTFSGRTLIVCLICVLVSLSSCAVAASADVVGQAAPSFLSGGRLGDPAVEVLAGAQQALAEEAMRASPEAVVAREVSRTKFSGIDRGAVVALAKEVFGLDHPAWTPLGDGHIAKYLSDSAAVEILPDGKHVVVESTVPLRSEVGTGQSAPTSLTLQDKGAFYEPANPLVPVSISKGADGGVSFPLGISVAPAKPASLESPELAGNSVIYPGATSDTDFIVEPLPSGVETSWQLRSQNSSGDNALVFTLPAGASLQLNPRLPDAAEVVSEGRTLINIPPALAREADGHTLRVSYSVNGDVLTTHVDLSGSVAFPVLVDPVISGGFGNYGAGEWTGWRSADNCGTGCYGFFQSANYLSTVIANAPWPGGYLGEWYIYAPGTGGAGITRVDIGGVGHQSEQSYFFGEIGFTNGSDPVWTFNSGFEAMGRSPYVSTAPLTNQPIAFCAQGAGGHDNGVQPLCDENFKGEFFRFGNEVTGWTSVYNYSEISGATVRFLDTMAPTTVRMEHLSNYWTRKPEYEIYAQDSGMGIEAFSVEIPPGHLNEAGQPFFAENISCPSGGIDGCPLSQKSKPVNMSSLNTGIYTLGVYAYDAASNSREEEVGPEEEEKQGSKVDPTLYVDKTPPKMAAFTGSLAEANNAVVGSGNYSLNFSAEDGSTSAPQSGVYSFTVSVDGRVTSSSVTSCPDPRGVPASNCYSFSGSWVFEGQKYGVGSHTITVGAMDWAGNEASQTVHVTVNESSYQSAGPGSVNLKSGDYKLAASDVAITGAEGELAVTRSYDSRELTQGAGGPLGPQWSLSLPDALAGGIWQNLQALPSGSVQLTATSGERVTFAPNGSGGYISPAGYQTDTLTEPSKSPAEYRLTDAGGAATIFTRPSTSSEEVPVFVPSGVVQAGGAGGLNKTTYLFTKTSEGIIEPTATIAPYPSTLKCSEKLEKHEEIVNGCRALTFSYATETKAKGESSSEWGEYKGRLTEIYLKTWSTTAGKIVTTPVAEYAYDALGRLRSVWNPEISPAIKTVYGYDPEGHVSAVTPPGQETWALTYGAIAGDSNTGRALKVTQAPASAKLWAGQSPKSTEAPKLSGAPITGVIMGVSHGAWSNEPVAYSYQWEDCNTEGKACTAILGATNANYKVASSDLGHTLVAQVTAINGGGSVSAVSAASATVTETGTRTEGEHYNPGPGITIEYHIALSGTGLPTMTKAEVEKWGQKEAGQKENIPVEATAIFPPDKTMGWPANEYTRATIYYEDGNNRVVNIDAPTGGISTTEYNSHDAVTRTLSADNRAVALKESNTVEAAEKLSTKTTYNSESTELEETLGPEHKVKLNSGSEVQARKKVKYTYNEEGAPTEGRPYRLVTSTKESALVAGKEEDPRTVSESYAGQENLGWKLHKPTSTTVDPEGLKLVHITAYSTSTGAVTETRMPAASSNVPATPIYTSQFGSLGTGNGQLKAPKGVASDGKGHLYVADENNSRIEEFGEKGEFIKTIGSLGSGNGQLKEPRAVAIDSKGDIWVADTSNERVEEFNEKGEFVRVVGSAGSENGHFKWPKGIAVDSHNNVFVGDTGNNRIQELNEKGEWMKSFGSVGAGNGQLKEPRGLVVASNGPVIIADTNNNRVVVFNEKGEYEKTIGSVGAGEGQFKEPKAVTTDSHNNIFVSDTENNRVEVFDEKVKYLLQFGSTGTGNGQFEETAGIQVNATGEVFIADAQNNRVQKWVPSNSQAHDSQIIYYTPGTEASVAFCQNHPEWANLPCETQPLHQPETTGLPALSVTTFTYNILDQPEVTKSTNGETSRTDTSIYDPAGRLTSKETTSTTGSPIPKIKYEYSPETGLLTKQSTGTGTEEQKITNAYNTLGQLTSYGDAEGSTTTYEYEKEGDARLKKITDPRGIQSYNYSITTGALKEVIDSAAGTFTASYDVEGNMINENYPNGMTAAHTYDSTGMLTLLKYTKTTHCTEEGTENCVMFKDGVVPDIRGEWMTQTSSLSSQSYSYDTAGRLTQVQSTPTGKGCTTRIYVYDADGNRTNLTTRAPNAEGKCTTEGGTNETHAYDSADRLIDSGTTYDAFGDLTTVSPADAGGSELKSSYFSDGQLSHQEQAGQTIGYTQDPARRTREIISTGKTTSTIANHYDGPGSTPAWTSALTGEWTRNIPGIDGALAAIQSNSEKPIIQIANLHGDIVGTAADSETEVHLQSSNDTTEYGMATTTTPPKYSWLGAEELSTELPSGVIAMGARSYIPQLGRFLQPDPIPGGSANAYAYTHGNPLNETDLSGTWTLNQTSGGMSAVGTGEGTQLTGGTGIGPGAIMPAPVNLQIEAAFEASPPWDQTTAGGEEYEEYEEEEYEEAAYHPGSKSAGDEAHLEDGVLYQPLGEMTGTQDHSISKVAVLCRSELRSGEKLNSQGACARFADFLGVGKAYSELWNTVKHSWGYHAIVKVVHFVRHNPVAKAIYSTGKFLYSTIKCAYGLAKSGDASGCNSF